MATGPINEGVFAVTQYTNRTRIAQFDLTNPKTLEEAKNSIKILLREKVELQRELDNALEIALRIKKLILSKK